MNIFQYSILLLLINLNIGFAQNNPPNKEVFNMLHVFYTNHFNFWKNNRVNSNSPANILRGKLETSCKKYCTVKARKEALNAYDYVGADWLTKDLIGDINENLKVEVDATRKNCYLVSFDATNPDIKEKPVKKKVILHVYLVWDGISYKIDSVK